MQKTILLMVACLSLWACNNASQQTQQISDSTQEASQEVNNGGIATFEEDSFDFGKITTGEVVSHEFTFKNTGTGTLLVKGVQVSCGCTSPEYTREPVAPGSEGKVTLSFNSSGFHGVQHKEVTIVTDGDPQNVKLHFQAEIQ